MNFIHKCLDMPFAAIFVIALADIAAICGVFYLKAFSPLILAPLSLYTLYAIALVAYWLFLFITLDQIKVEMEVWAIIRKKSVTLALSMELNLLFSIYYLYIGLANDSTWFLFVSFFYFSLTIARFILLRQFCLETNSFSAHVKRYIASGYMILAMMACLMALTIMAVNVDYVADYPGNTIYFQTAFSIYLITSAIRNYRKYRKYRSPLLSGSQMISIAGASLGILSLQTAYYPRLSSDLEDIHKTIVFTSLMLYSIMISMSIYMIVHGHRSLSLEE